MDKKRLSHRWSSVLRVVAAMMIMCSMPNPSFASKNWYTYGPEYTGPIGRVLEWRMGWTLLYGTTAYSSVSFSTDPNRPMLPVTNTYPYPGLPGYTFIQYVRHEHNYTPSPQPTVMYHSGQTSSSMIYPWGTSNLEP